MAAATETTHVSFALLDDLKPLQRLDDDVPLTRDALYEFVGRAADLFGPEMYDPTHFFWTEDASLRDRPHDIEDIAEQLLRDRRYTWNHIVFALDYARSEVFSKDYDKQLMKWRENDANDPIVGEIDDPDYNMNPVLRLLRREAMRE